MIPYIQLLSASTSDGQRVKIVALKGGNGGKGGLRIWELEGNVSGVDEGEEERVRVWCEEFEKRAYGSEFM